MLADRDYLRPSTIDNYRIYAARISLHIGHIAVEDVQPQDIARMDRANREALVGATAAQVLTLLNTLYERLMALRIVSYNPVKAYRAITPARARRGTPLRQPVKLDVGMTRRVLDKIDPEYYPVALWFFALGPRWGELCGLRAVNVRDRVVHIVEQRSRKSRYEATDPKTEDSPRTLPLPDVLLSVVDLSGDLVFTDEQGRPLNYSYYRVALAAACKAAGVLVTRPHDTRHTAAHNLQMIGCPQQLISQYLGHRVTSQTEHYTRGPEEVLRPWVEQWAGALLGGSNRVRRMG